jgi:hypothetical protein
MYLTEKQIATVIQTDLNTIATTLYDATTIATKVVFYVTPNLHEYDRIIEMEYEVDDDIVYTPVLLKRVSSSIQDDFIQGTYTEAFLTEILAFENDKDSIEIIFNQYAYNESVTDSKVISGWTVLKARTSQLKFVRTYDATDGSDKTRIGYMFDFTWQFVLGGIMDSASSFTIDGNSIDVIGVNYSSDKLAIANIAYGTNVLPVGATGFVLSLTIPAQNLAPNIALFEDLASKKFNKSYAVVWTIADFNTQSYSMIMRSGTLNYVRDQLLSYTLTFEEALPRTSITVDTQVLPVLSFNLLRNVKTKGNADGIEIKNTPQETGYTMSIKFGYISSLAKSRELLQAILDKNYMTNTYTIVVTATGGVTKSYTAYLAGGSYAFEQTGELMYDCTFVEVHPNGIV